jgi:hypothetical protein
MEISATSHSGTLICVRKVWAHRSKLPHRDRAIQEEILAKKSTGKRATSVEDGNSTDVKDKAGRMIAAISTKELTKPNGRTKHGQTDASRRNGSAEDRKPERSDASSRKSPAEDRKPAGYKDKDPVQEMEMARGTIELATTKGSTRRDRSPRMPTRAKGTKGMKGVDGTGQGRKYSLEKCTLTISQTEETPESLHYPESRRSTSEDNVTQKEMDFSFNLVYCCELIPMALCL